MVKKRKKAKKRRRGKNKRDSSKKVIYSQKFHKAGTIILFLLIIATCMIIIKFFYDSYTIVEIRRIPVEVRVSETLGLGFKNDVMMFGGVPPGAASKREIVIVNYKNESLKVDIKFKGEMGRWVEVESSNFVLGSNESRRIGFVISIPESAKEGEYKGEADIFFRKAI